ncbi:MAG: mandelate racemase/muconate lactonizing enzyme family protein [Pseudomonadota bacterium]
MKISRISVFQVDVPIEPFPISKGRVTSSFDETLVRIETDTGITGWGDSVPWGSNFVAAFARGVRAGLDELAPRLIGEDPAAPARLYEIMDYEMSGQSAVKSPLDVACWDILGKSLGVPLYALLGGMVTPRPMVVGSVPAKMEDVAEAALARWRALGVAQLSSKLTGDIAADIAFLRWIGERMRPGESLKVDGNGGLRVDEAIRIARGAGDIDLYFEQPCATYEECREVRRTTGVPLILDESATDLGAVLRAREDGVLDGLNLKLAKVGGISKMRVIRDVCVALNVPMEIQDSSWSELACTVLAHFGHSTPSRCIRSVMPPKGLKLEKMDNPLRVEDGAMLAPAGSGIASSPVLEKIGNPVAVYG